VVDLGVQVLRRPVRAPQANSLGERLGVSLRRACLDWFISLNERHLRTIGRFWTSLPPRQAAQLSWSWLAGTPPGERSGEWPRTPALPCCEKVCAWRPA
jgi:hypothetical protein